MTSDHFIGDESSPAHKPAREFLLRDPEEAPRRARRKRFAFTAATVLITAAIGTVGARYLTAQWAIERSYTEWMLADLERLVIAQSEFRDRSGRFADTGELGVSFVPSQAVHVTIGAADDTGWHAYATHLRSDERCLVTVGTGPSALRNIPSAQPTCDAQ